MQSASYIRTTSASRERNEGKLDNKGDPSMLTRYGFGSSGAVMDYNKADKAIKKKKRKFKTRSASR